MEAQEDPLDPPPYRGRMGLARSLQRPNPRTTRGHEPGLAVAEAGAARLAGPGLQERVRAPYPHCTCRGHLDGTQLHRLAGRRIEIAGAVSFEEPLFLWSPGLVHASAALHGGPGFNVLHPTDHMRVRCDVKELGGFIDILGH